MRCTCALALPVAPHTFSSTHLSTFITTQRPAVTGNGEPGDPGRGQRTQPHTHTLTHHTTTTHPSRSQFPGLSLDQQPRLLDLWSCRTPRSTRRSRRAYMQERCSQSRPPCRSRLRGAYPHSNLPVSIYLSIYVSLSHLACSSRPGQIKTSGPPLLLNSHSQQ